MPRPTGAESRAGESRRRVAEGDVLLSQKGVKASGQAYELRLHLSMRSLQELVAGASIARGVSATL